MTAIAMAPPPAAPALEARHATSFVGMALALGSFAMLFASLFFAYAVVRYHSPAWPPAGTPRLPRALPALNTLVLLGSSLVLRRRTRAAVAGTLGLGALFLGLQLAVWVPLWRGGLTLASGIYGSVFYALTALHAVHAAAGLLALAATAGNAARLRLAAMFWHFVGLVWVVMFAAVYLL